MALNGWGLIGTARSFRSMSGETGMRQSRMKWWPAAKPIVATAARKNLKKCGSKPKPPGGQLFMIGAGAIRPLPTRPTGIAPVVRIKAPLSGDAMMRDEVQGEVRVATEQLDDFILLRSDGTPTYMLSVVVDDHDMGVTHVIRGDDHLNNTFRQNIIYDAMGWRKPIYAHLPMILAPDGSKMSKRHGAASIEEYRAMGLLPEAVRNYLLRLGWSHGGRRNYFLTWRHLHGSISNMCKNRRRGLITLNSKASTRIISVRPALKAYSIILRLFLQSHGVQPEQLSRGSSHRWHG